MNVFFCFFLIFFFVYIVEARVRANTQHTTRSVEVKGMGWGTWGKQDGHHRDFQNLARQGTFGKESKEFD